MINKRSLSKTLPLTGASLLAVTTVFGSANVATAATFGFSFSNVDGPVNGTVEGTIELPDGDGTFAATSVFITSAPAALGYTTPLDAFTIGDIAANSFTVANGMIDFSASSFGVSSSLDVFTLNFGSGIGSQLNIQGSGSLGTGVVDLDNSTLIDAATTPEPTTIFGLLLVGGVGLLSKRQKQAK